MLSGMPSRRRQKRHRENQLPHKTEQHDERPMRTKRPKASYEDVFDSYMTDDTFLMVLRFFVADSGLVDGESLRSIMLVSKPWYTAANSPSLWTLPEAQCTKKEHPMYRIPQRPSPLIREICQHPPRSFQNLIGFAKLGRRDTNDGRPLYSVRERATGKLFLIDILDFDGNRAIQSAMSAHHLLGDGFLKSNLPDDSSLFIPVGMEGSNGKVVRWYKHADSLKDWLRSQQVVSLGSTLSLEILKDWLRQMLEAAHKIHCTDAVHSYIEPSNVYLTLSTGSQTTSATLACPSLFPVVSSVEPPTRCLKYTSPELLIPLSKGLRIEPTSAADIFSIGCVMAEVFRNGVPLFGPGPNEWEGDGRMISVSRYARKVCRLVGRPLSCSSAMRSLQHNEFPLDSTVSSLHRTQLHSSPFRTYTISQLFVMTQKNLKRELGELDADGCDLMTKLLSPDPSKRPTAEDALAHPFLVRPNPTRPIKALVGEPLRWELKRIVSYVTRESQCQQLSSTRKHVRMDAWATLVDYVVEIVEVFDLEISAAFRAMGYFDRFFSSYQGSVSAPPQTLTQVGLNHCCVKITHHSLLRVRSQAAGASLSPEPASTLRANATR